MKKCQKCKSVLKEELFNRNKNKPDGLATECKSCRKLYMSQYYANNREKLKLKNSKRNKARHNEAKIKVIEHYTGGDIKCMCSGCEVTEIEFLSVEHINGGGQEDRNKSGARTFYERLVKDNYPEDIEILCFNCNLSRGFHGYCPHEKH